VASIRGGLLKYPTWLVSQMTNRPPPRAKSVTVTCGVSREQDVGLAFVDVDDGVDARSSILMDALALRREAGRHLVIGPISSTE